MVGGPHVWEAIAAAPPPASGAEPALAGSVPVGPRRRAPPLPPLPPLPPPPAAGQRAGQRRRPRARPGGGQGQGRRRPRAAALLLCVVQAAGLRVQPGLPAGLRGAAGRGPAAALAAGVGEGRREAGGCSKAAGCCWPPALLALLVAAGAWQVLLGCSRGSSTGAVGRGVAQAAAGPGSCACAAPRSSATLRPPGPCRASCRRGSTPWGAWTWPLRDSSC
jgi:hypothetical protein